MSTDMLGALPMNEANEPVEVEDVRASEPATTTPRGRRESRWRVATKTAGLAPAQIIVQRLRAEGIPARAWQEGAGQAIGLTVGLLGTGYVMVPAAQLERAKALLSETEAVDRPLEEEE